MASNSSGSAGSAGSSNDDAVTLKLTNAALAISIGAFFLSILQAVLAYLQFDNSSVGRRRCSAEVMGELWASKTEAVFKRREWRYQIFFEVPVFYTAPPTITVGPLTRIKPIPKKRWFDRFRSPASSEENEDTHRYTDKEIIDMEEINVQKHVQPIYKITGTENSHKLTMTRYTKTAEKWANVHTADDEGCSWIYLLDALQSQEKLSRQWDTTSTPKRELGEGHTFCYLIQRKRRCWDFMPLNATKPFATTNICHLIEMMATLGLVWKEVDLKNSALTAEGNGYMVKSEYAQGLGILARFSRLSNPNHGEHRLIPCNEIKRLCFGDVPSLFDSVKQSLWVSPDRLELSLKHLLPTLDPEQRRVFADVGRLPRPSMFSITFELIAMLAKPLHIRGSKFRRLPNPCADTWTPGLDIVACLRAFAKNVEAHAVGLGRHRLTTRIQTLFERGQMDAWSMPNQQTLNNTIKLYSNAISRLSESQVRRYDQPTMTTPMVDPRQAEIEQATLNHDIRFLEMLDSLHQAIEQIDQELEDLLKRSDVRGVIAAHFTAILQHQRALNDMLAKAAGEHGKETALLDFYFKTVHPAAAAEPAESNPQTTSDSASAMSASTTTSDSKTLCSTISDERSAIWLGLMFRMWAWLFLHDFNSEDKMIERSELKNNRLPVYIG